MMPDRRILRACGLLVVAMAALTAAQAGLDRLAAGQHPPTSTGAPGELLVTLAVAPEASGAGYVRARFGDGWSLGADGCDTRSEVLRTESIIPATIADGCVVVAGEWRSVYDAAVVADPSGLDVDHLVPLAEAWVSGASTWTDEQREAFANDLAHPDALVAVTAGSNRAKGNSDPAHWMPPNRAVWCWYAAAWVAQKAAWGLSVDVAEHQALAAVLATCPHEGGQP